MIFALTDAHCHKQNEGAGGSVLNQDQDIGSSDLHNLFQTDSNIRPWRKPQNIREEIVSHLLQKIMQLEVNWQ